MTECGHAVFGCIIMDIDVMNVIGAAKQLRGIVGTPPEDVVMLLNTDLGKHLLHHAYEYRRKFDAELIFIRRLEELQVRQRLSVMHLCLMRVDKYNHL
jgi:hypothetical protein